MSRCRQMRSRLFTIASVLSVLLCIATALLWARSYHESHTLYWLGQYAGGHREVAVELMASAGGLSAQIWRFDTKQNGYTGDIKPGLHCESDLPWRYEQAVFGFGCGKFIAGPGDTTLWAELPLWLMPMLPLIAGPAMWFRHLLRQPRAGCCGRCGYDLRASIGRCPECGTPILVEEKG